MGESERPREEEKPAAKATEKPGVAPRGPGSKLRKVAAGVAGVAVGLAIAEGAFYLRDDGAFPHLNVYQADDALGLRLRPGATQRVKFGGAEVTDIRINSEGFRGADWPAPKADDVLMLGDSQVFGLGVQENETLPKALSEALGGRTVLNAGVPTWGPIEYNLALKELLPKRKPKLVVLVLNVFNDPFEAARPNTERHKAWDGWAVRQETAPASTYAFPGRAWLFGRSHAFFALRRLIYGRGPEANRVGMPSEGAWDELFTEAKTTEGDRTRAEELNKELIALHEDEISHAADALLGSQMHVERLADLALQGSTTDQSGQISLSTARATPGDIVDYGDGGEFARPGPVTAKHIQLAVKMRNEIEKKLLEHARAKADEARSKDIVRTLEQQEQLSQRLAALRESPARVVRAMSPLTRRLEETKKICDEAGASLLVVVIPMDVQVSPEEWKKYGHEPMDMEPTRVLIADAVEATEDLGAKGLDATEALRAANPGVFLPRDLHLTAKGHKALAAAIVARLEGFDPKVPRGGLPPGRSRLPRLDEWNSVGETHVVGSTMRGCITKRIREWIALWCGESDPFQGVGAAATGVKVLKGGRGETLVARWEGPKYDWVGGEFVPSEKRETKTVLVAPVLPGDELLADFFWPTKKSTLVVRFPEDVSKHVVAFQKFSKQPSEPMPISDDAKNLCECHKKLTGADSCVFLVAQPNSDCKRTYGEDCKSLLACSSGDPLYAPSCAAGYARGGAMERCYPLCGPSRSCTEGVCTDWQGGELCMPEGAAPSQTRKAPELPPSPQVGALSDKVVQLAKEVVLRAKELTAACELVNVNQGSYYYDVYDKCPVEDKQSAALTSAIQALQKHLDETPSDRAGEAAILATRATLLSEWLDLSRRRGSGRGMLVRFAEIVDDWNRWQPESKIAPYSDKVMEQYRTGKRTKGKAAGGGTIVWQRCKSGPCL